MTEKWNKYLSNQNKKISKLQDTYDRLKKSGTADEIKQASKELQKAKMNLTLRNKYYKEMVDVTTDKLAHVNEIAVQYINGQIPNIYTINYNDAYKDQVEGIKGISYNLVDEHTVAHLVKTNKLDLPSKTINIPKDKRWNTKQINSAVLQGILQGESINKIANRLLPIVENNSVASVRTARTMTTSAENKGRMDRITNLTEQGLELEKTWLATSDSRTRESHLHINGETIKTTDEFSNGLQYPGDPNGDPSEVYNCRCTLITNVLGLKGQKIEQETATETTEMEEITTRQGAIDFLNTIFATVEKNVSRVDEQLLCESMTQLQRLNSRFKVLKADNKGIFSTKSRGRAEAFVSYAYNNNPQETNLNLCSKYFRDREDFRRNQVSAREAKWAMPFDDDYISVYAVTHEYGHALELEVCKKRQEWGGILGENYVDDPRRELAKREQEIRKEIVQIAKDKNSEFNLSENISQYGASNDAEFFAETFANSQCGKPNELGNAMLEWLKKEGF